MKKQKKYVLRIIAILVCAFATNILSICITKTYSAFNDSKSAQVKADVSTENQMFNVDIVYKVWDGSKWALSTCRVIGENVTYNSNNPITNPTQIVVSPISNKEIVKDSIPKIIYFEVQENLQQYVFHINPVKYNGERAQTYININTKKQQDNSSQNQSDKSKDGYTTGYLKIKYSNEVIDKSINIQFENKEMDLKDDSEATKQWYDIEK